MPKKELVYTNKEDIVHYRAQDERFFREVETHDVKKVKVDSFFEDDIEEEGFGNVRMKSSSSIHERHVEEQIISNEEFKLGMQDDNSVGVLRDTVVVTEDLTTKNVSFKKFIYRKQLVNVINKKTNLPHKKKYFKVITSIQYSLTINKETGDFTVYSRGKEKSKRWLTIRKNISGNKVKELLQEMYRRGSLDVETSKALGIFYQLLGYAPLLNFGTFVKHYFDDVVQPLDENRTSLIMMPFYNYLKKLKIDYHGYDEFHTLEFMFKKDKNKFRDKTSADFYNHYYKFKNPYIGETIRQKLYETTAHHIFKYNHLKEKNRAGNMHTASYFPQTPNHLMLWICDVFGATNEMIDVLNPLSNTTSNYVEGIPAYIGKLIKLYKFDVLDLALGAENNGDFYKTFKELLFFSYFGIKLNIKSIVDYQSRYDTFAKLYDCLAYARIRSGTVEINQEFYDIIRSAIPETATISMLNANMIKERIKFEYDININEFGSFEQNYRMKYQWWLMLPYFRVKYEDKVTNLRLNIYSDSVDGAGFKHGQHNYIPGLDDIIHNENKVLSKLNIKQIYSKQLFEKFYKENFPTEPNLLYEYIE